MQHEVRYATWGRQLSEMYVTTYLKSTFNFFTFIELFVFTCRKSFCCHMLFLCAILFLAICLSPGPRKTERLL